MIIADILLRYRMPKRSRAQAKRDAPNPPTAPGLLYLRDLMRIRRAWKAHVLAELTPMLAEIAGERQDMTLLPPELTTKIAQLRTQAFSLFTSERVTTFLRVVGVRTAAHARREVSRVIGIPLTDVIPEGRLGSFQIENVNLISRAAGDELDGIAEALDKAQRIGMRVEELADQIKDRFGVGDSRAALIARDQTLKLNADISQDRMTMAGITEYVWITSHDERVRKAHASLNGKTFSFSDPPVTDDRTGARNNPGGDFQCRCTGSPVIDGLL